MYRNLFSSTLVAVAAMACFSFADNSDPCAIPATLAQVDGVYQIGTCGDLYKFAQMANGGDYSISGKLTANIVVNEGLLDYVNKEDASFNLDAYRADHNGAEPKAWTPIGKYWSPFNDDGDFRAFNGILNGDGWTVSGLYFNDPTADYVGLVGYLSVRYVDEDYRVENVGVVESYFYGRNAVGAVVGGNNQGVIRNVYNTGVVKGKNFVGGVFGTSSGYISYVYNTGLVKGSSYVGGVAGADCLVFEEALDDLEQYENWFEWSELYNAYYDASVASVAAGYWNNAKGFSSEQFTDGTVLALLNNGQADAPWKEDPVTHTPVLRVPQEDGPSSVDGVFQIASAEDLLWFANKVSTSTASDVVKGKLTEDICLNACDEGESVLTSEGALNGDGADFTQWTPISVAYGVTVVLDGDNKKISGLYINDSDAGTGSSVGLFGVSSGTLTVSNLSLVDSYIMGYQNVGSLVGSSAGPLTVKNVLNSASVAATLINAGGLVGNTGSSETYIESSGNLGSVASLGTSVGDYPGASPAGFIACAIGGQVTITKSFNKGAVSGFNNNAGGFVGYADGVTISITQSYNEGLVSGTWGAGGLLGSVYSSDEDDVVTLANVYNTADVNGTGAVAGLVGDMNGFKGKALSITNSYSSGRILKSMNVILDKNGNPDKGAWGYGGLVGYAGNAKAKLSIVDSYFDVETFVGRTVGDVYASVDGVDEFADLERSSTEFADGTIAKLLHDYNADGVDGSMWGQNVTLENSVPTFTDVQSHKVGPVAYIEGKDGFESVHVDGSFTGNFELTEDVIINTPVSIARNFPTVEGENTYSTVMFPFNAEVIPEGVSVYEFDGVTQTDGKWSVNMKIADAIVANKPYLVQVKAGTTSIDFGKIEKLVATNGPSHENVNGDWKFVGTYEYKTWKNGDPSLGMAYGFAANDGVNDPSIVGQFAKIGEGAYIYPMRSYLEYRGSKNPAPRLQNSTSVARLNNLPEEIEVVIVDKAADETAEVETMKVIGSFNTRTGEFKFASDRWFDLNGRYLGSKKPSQKGAYYNNGKKVVVK